MTKPGARRDIRHEIPAHPNPDEGGRLLLFGELVDFFREVKDTARLRAKEEGGIRFLHTRTGTVFGRLWKFLTRGTEGAIRQRELARDIVKKSLDYINYDTPEINSIKNRILSETLQVKWYKEFDIATLRTQLVELKTLAEQAGKQKPPQISTEIAHRPDIATSSSSARRVDSDPVVANGTSSVASNDTRLLSAVESLKSKSPIPDLKTAQQKTSLSEPNGKDHSQPDSIENDDPWLPTEISPEASAVPVATAPLQMYIDEPRAQGQRGLLKINEGFAISQTGQMQRYEADVYVLPANMPLKFQLGTLDLQPRTTTNGILVEQGIHHTPQRTRPTHPLLKMTLNLLADEEQGASFESRTRRLYQQLFQTISDCKNQSDIRIESIAITPFRRQLLSESEARIFVEEVNRFQKAHPKVGILVVAVGPTEAQRIQQARQQLDQSAFSTAATPLS